MESVVEVPPKKPKARQSINLPVSECIRQFELPQQFPSTVTELRLSNPGTEKSVTVQTKSVQNIISALPLSGNMKFIPNKEITLSKNLQKLKLKRLDGKDVGEIKLVPGNEEKLQTKVVTMTKVGQKTEKPITWTIKSSGESAKPKIKTITRIINTSSSLEECLKESEERTSPKMKIQLINSNKSSAANVTQNGKFTLANLKRISNTNGNESMRPKFVIHGADNDFIKKFVLENSNMLLDKQNGPSQLITLKKIPGPKKVMVMQNDQILKTVPEKVVSLKPMTQGSSNNHNVQKSIEKIVFKSSLNGSMIKRKESSFAEQSKSHESKKPRLDIVDGNSKTDQHDNIEILNSESLYSNKKNSVKPAINTVPRKNVMVIVPNKAAEELTIVSNSSDVSNKEIVEEDGHDKVLIPDSETVTEAHQASKNFNNDFINTYNHGHLISNVNQEENWPMNINETNNINKNINNENAKSQDLLDKFNILKKAVLSVQDAKLRADALKALKDCGIKVKKRMPLKRPTTTKVINESGTQTEVFSLLKDGEFLEVTEDSEDLVKIKQNRILMKQPISTLSTNRSVIKIYSEQNSTQYQNNLDNMLQKMFPNDRGIFDVKEAFAQNKIAQAKAILERLKQGFKAATNYDDDGLLGIHRAVMNNNLQEVQKHILMLRLAKQSIDIYSQDDKTSLELAIEFDKNPQITKVLLDAGAQPVSSKPVHDSAIILAAKASSKILPLLLKYVNPSNRSLLNAKNSDGFAAIHYCAQLGNLEGVVGLLKHCVDVNLQDKRSGRTALFYAVDIKNGDVPQETYYEIAHKLLERGAISNIPTFSKHSVLSLIDDVKSHSLKIALNKAVK